MANPQAEQSVTLDSFLGLVTNFAPESLPMGASPLNWDVDFIAGEVFGRAGLVSSYIFATNALLHENGDFFLLEDDSGFILLET